MSNMMREIVGFYTALFDLDDAACWLDCGLTWIGFHVASGSWSWGPMASPTTSVHSVLF
jgi:hypothetical protein